jgi:23S rRNA A2030 N6-methylase RlmJ
LPPSPRRTASQIRPDLICDRHTGVIYTSAGPDVLAFLPAAAADRLRALRQKARDAHSLRPEFADRHEANTARGDAERRLQRLLAPRAQRGFDLRETTRKSLKRDDSLRS